MIIYFGILVKRQYFCIDNYDILEINLKVNSMSIY